MYYIYQNDFVVNKYVLINLIGFFFFFSGLGQGISKSGQIVDQEVHIFT